MTIIISPPPPPPSWILLCLMMEEHCSLFVISIPLFPLTSLHIFPSEGIAGSAAAAAAAARLRRFQVNGAENWTVAKGS